MHPQAFESNAAAEALANLAQATETDCNTVASLANANMQLTIKVANLTTKLSAKDRGIAALLGKMVNSSQQSKTLQQANHWW
eukprot:11713655-Ditylum_brightwellii.AAC.1